MNPRCPCCGPGEGFLLGTLGNLRWYRCRSCGVDFARKVKPRKKKVGS